MIHTSIAAKIEGREPPTDLPEDDSIPEFPFFFLALTRRELNEEDEDPIKRELRLRAEAKERLQKKFGAGGLKSQAVGSSPIPPGGYGQQPSSPQPGDEYCPCKSSM